MIISCPKLKTHVKDTALFWMIHYADYFSVSIDRGDQSVVPTGQVARPRIAHRYWPRRMLITAGKMIAKSLPTAVELKGVVNTEGLIFAGILAWQKC